MRFDAVLFDLDGTLVDTAPDLVAVLNRLLAASGRVPVPFALARNHASDGAVGLLRLGFGADLTAAALETLRRRFLTLYGTSVCVKSRVFGGLSDILKSGSKYRWGIVTNKPHALTEPLLAALDVRSSCVVSGDRLPQRKPHPAPLLLAAAELGVPPQRCVYVGDAPRDIEAGRAAGMATVTAAYGYIRPGTNLGQWGADAILRRPADLPAILTALSSAHGHRAA